MILSQCRLRKLYLIHSMEVDYGSPSSSDWLDRLLGKKLSVCWFPTEEEAARLHGHVRHGARIQISPGAPLFLLYPNSNYVLKS